MLFLIFGIVFFISGLTGLIYESIWSHYLKLFLGHSAYAQTLVLCIFMGGMAIGSAITARYSHKIRSLILSYAIVEGVIGVLGIIFHSVFLNTTDFAYRSLFGIIDSSMVVSLIKWSISALLILPQSVLLGATFPLLSGGLIRLLSDRPGATISLLYFTNSLGASIGVLLSGFFLIDFVGLPGTILSAGLLNVLLAIVVYMVCKRLPEVNTLKINQRDEEKLFTIDDTIKAKWLLLVAFGTGLASFIYEIAWIRMLSLVLGSSTHSFELMLSAFILGLALGGLIIKRFIERLKEPFIVLSWIQIIMGIFAFLTIFLYQSTFELMVYSLKAIQRTDEGYIFFNLISHAISMLIMLPSTICAGMTLPLITYIILRIKRQESVIGGVYAINTVGSIVGVIIAIAVLMPYLGLKYTITIGAMVDVSLGILLLFMLSKTPMLVKMRLVSAAVIVVMGVIVFVVKWNLAISGFSGKCTVR
ncbi:MAG: hypothetical protein SNJ53_08705 [Thermodesulfovibrionales bacterium]